MKIRTTVGALAGILILVLGFMLPISAYADTLNYTANANWNQAACTGSVNGTNQGVKNGQNVPAGDDVNVALVNQSSITLNYSFTLGSDTPVYGTVAAGATYNRSYTNLQSPLQISAYPDPNQPCAYKFDAGMVTLIPTASSSTTTTPTTTTPSTSSTTTTSSPATAVAAPTATTIPTAVQLSSVLVAGKTVDTSKSIEFNQSQSLKLAGHTTNNGVVSLTIHSTPKTVTTTADANGNWSYTVTGLAPGSHYIEASVTDPVTKQA